MISVAVLEVREAQGVFFLCMQSIAENQEQLKDPSISMGRRGQLERSVKLWKHAIQSSQELIVSFDSALQGESCRLKCPSSGGQMFSETFFHSCVTPHCWITLNANIDSYALVQNL